MEGSDPNSIEITDIPVVVGRSSGANVRLFHPTVSRKHATIRRQAAGLLVQDNDSRFGTFINGTRVRSSEAHFDDRIQFGTAIVYRVTSSGLLLEESLAGLRIATTELGISREDKILVQGLTIEIEPDSFIGILGPSGAGKTTLLNCLGGYLAPHAGRVVFDDADVTHGLGSYLHLIGYVTQEDIVYPSLTARENLLFAAKLRLGSAVTSIHVDEAVDRALSRTKLTDHKNKSARKLSGGQRKRLSVAIELLKRPRLLLLDEPTSGLDPASEAALMEHLRQVARQGTTTVCATHLMENTALFDEVLVLGVRDQIGRPAFLGKPADLLPAFGCRSFADLYEKLAKGDFQPLDARSSALANTLIPAPSDDSNLPPATDTHAAGERAVGKTGERPFWQSTQALLVQALASPQWLQLLLVCWRALVVLRRDRWLLATVLAQPIVLGGLVCLTQYRASATSSILFFLVILAIWLGMNNSIRDLVRERKLYLRDRLAGLNPAVYFASKAIVFGALGIVQIVLLLIVVRVGERRVFSDFRSTSTVWLFLVLLLSYLGAIAIGLGTSSLVRTEAAALAALPLLLMPQLLLSAVATGEVDKRYDQPRGFRPLVATLMDSDHAPEQWCAKAVDVLSLACISRPATLLAESPRLPNFNSVIWMADLIHLAFLLFVSWTLAYFIFRRSEARWPRLIDLE